MKSILSTLALLLPLAQCSPLASTGLDDFDLDSEAAAEHQEFKRARPVCPSSGVHILVTSGAGPNRGHDYGRLISVVDDIKSRIPSSDNYSLPYHRTNVARYFEHAVAKAAALLTKNIQSYVHWCEY